MHLVSLVQCIFPANKFIQIARSSLAKKLWRIKLNSWLFLIQNSCCSIQQYITKVIYVLLIFVSSSAKITTHFFFHPFRLKIIHSNFGRQSTFLRIDNCTKSGRCLELSSIWLLYSAKPLEKVSLKPGMLRIEALWWLYFSVWGWWDENIFFDGPTSIINLVALNSKPQPMPYDMRFQKLLFLCPLPRHSSCLISSMRMSSWRWDGE